MRNFEKYNFSLMTPELTNNIRKLVKSLGDARSRKETGLFVAEGAKCVFELINAFRVRYLFATNKWIEQNKDKIAGREVIIVTNNDIERMSQLRTPQPVIGVFELPVQCSPGDLKGKLILALDRVQDPGNLGTIMRIADWFGIDTILASYDTVDVFNPKVVQATMGGMARVKVFYVNLPETLSRLKESMPIYGTSLSGDNLYSMPLQGIGVIVMGNEGKGMSAEVEKCVSHKLYIPPFPADAECVESLNVSMATAVIVSEFRRRTL